MLRIHCPKCGDKVVVENISLDLALRIIILPNHMGHGTLTLEEINA